MGFEDDDEEEDVECDSAEEDDYDSDYDDEADDDDEADEPATDEFIYAMLARSEARAKNRDTPKAWSPGDPLDLD